MLLKYWTYMFDLLMTLITIALFLLGAVVSIAAKQPLLIGLMIVAIVISVITHKFFMRYT